MNAVPHRGHYVQLHLLVLLLATTAVIGHLISLSAPGLVAWRTLLAAPGAALTAALVFRKQVWLPWRQALRVIGVGIIVGIHWMAFFGAIKISNISICLAGMATVSFFTAFTEPWVEKRRVRLSEVWLGLLVVVGILMIAGVSRGHWLGLACALLGAFLAAVFPVFNSHFVRRERLDPVVLVAWEMVGAFAACVVLLPWLDGPGAYARALAPTAMDLVWLVVLAWVCTVFAHAYHIHLLRHLSAYTGNLAMNFEPVYGIVAAALLFGEHRQLHPGFYVGAATIFAANLIHPVLLHRAARRAREMSLPGAPPAGP